MADTRKEEMVAQGHDRASRIHPTAIALTEIAMASGAIGIEIRKAGKEADKEVNKMKYNPIDFQNDLQTLIYTIQSWGLTFEGVYGVPRGGCLLAQALEMALGIPLVAELPIPLAGIPAKRILVVDDIINSGTTRKRYKDYSFIALFRKTHSPDSEKTFTLHTVDSDVWVDFWWEGDGEKDIEDVPRRMMQFIGEDVTREGLLETPRRVVKSWGELYAGYKQNPKDVLKTFEEDSSDEIVLLANIEFYSMCEHHMLPFFGKAHIAYLPQNRVVGISKLARLLDIFSRRLQIQERLCQQVTQALMEELEPKGAACILEAQHFCMVARGVQKQNSVMVTSSLEGVFREEPKTRGELLELIHLNKS